jgi:hypothetical protein
LLWLFCFRLLNVNTIHAHYIWKICAQHGDMKILIAKKVQLKKVRLPAYSQIFCGFPTHFFCVVAFTAFLGTFCRHFFLDSLKKLKKRSKRRFLPAKTVHFLRLYIIDFQRYKYLTRLHSYSLTKK